MQWIGTEHNDSAQGKQELRQLLGGDVRQFPNEIYVEMEEPDILPISDTVS